MLYTIYKNVSSSQYQTHINKDGVKCDKCCLKCLHTHTEISWQRETEDKSRDTFDQLDKLLTNQVIDQSDGLCHAIDQSDGPL